MHEQNRILTKICDIEGNMSFLWDSYWRPVYFRGTVRPKRNYFTDPYGSLVLNKQECLRVHSIDLTVHCRVADDELRH